MAALAAVVHANPDLIRRLIRQVGPDEYEVTLFRKKEELGSPHASVHKVIVDDRFPCDDENHAPVYAQYTGSIWVMLFEKAFATLEGSYSGIQSGSPAQGLDALLAGGASQESTREYEPDALGRKIAAALKHHRPVTALIHDYQYSDLAEQWLDHLALTHASLATWLNSMDRTRYDATMKQTNAVNDHVYAVISVDLASNHIQLQNPWGHADLNLTFKQFKQLFVSFSIGNV